MRINNGETSTTQGSPYWEQGYNLAYVEKREVESLTIPATTLTSMFHYIISKLFKMKQGVPQAVFLFQLILVHSERFESVLGGRGSNGLARQGGCLVLVI